MTLFQWGFLLTLERFATFIFFINFEQVDALWDDNDNNNDNSHAEDVNRIEFTSF